MRDELKQVIPLATFLTPNEVEMEKISKDYDFEKLLDSGTTSIILKLGERGIFYKSKAECFSIPAFSVNVVDTTSAGDTFNGAFAADLSQGKNLKETLVFASAASAISVTRKGAAISSP
ncbi:MAG: PfkB family carbohydrate kinase [Caldiserica bacterium]|jgi:ribokinase|nr:PfkB family carbohydrate kinase [Caldisericota bacterium]